MPLVQICACLVPLGIIAPQAHPLRCLVPGAPMPDAEFERLKRRLRTGAICVAVALLPVHIPLAVASGIINVPSAIYGLNGTCAERCCRRAVASNYKQQRKIVDACGRRRPHEFVSGWCQPAITYLSG